MIRTGIDLIKISRFENTQNFGSLVERVCIPSEKEWLLKHPRQTEKLAGVYALKEAFSKALGTGIGSEFSFKDLEVTFDGKGRPLVSYVGAKFEKKAVNWEIAASISHDEGFLVAIIVIEGDI